MSRILPLSFAALLASVTIASAQVEIEMNLDTRHKMGDVDSFDRPKFVNFHATPTEGYWDRGNAFDDLRKELIEKYDVYMGRDTGGLKSNLLNAPEDPKRPGFVDPSYLVKQGQIKRESYAKKVDIHKYEKYTNMILCNQFHPFYPDGNKNRKGWALSTADTEKEPYGTASGDFYGRYVKESFGKGGTTGEPMPKYLEIINEPLWDIYDMQRAPKSSIRMMCEFHATVAKEVRKHVSDIPIGGYVTAFPNFEEQDFERWRVRWREFIDIAGEQMDFWSIHLYDFPAYGKNKRYRKGSNMEATMDMIEQYSMMKFGKVKPLMISEYGAQTHNYNRKMWSPYRDWLKIASMNSMMMQFMERANNINIAMPFFMLRSDWGYNPTTGIPHTSRVMRREGEAEGKFTGDYVFGEAIKAFQLWKDVKGTRVETSSANLDVLADAYVDESTNTAYLILSNLSFEPMELSLSVNGMAKGAKSIELRHLYLEGGVDGAPILDITESKSLSGFTIGAEATAIIVYKYPSKVKINKLMEQTKYYATDYLKLIEKSKPIDFEINSVVKSAEGAATLRLGIGRDHGKSLKPELKVNGTVVTIPDNFRGDDQKDRLTFFGVLEIPVDYALLKENNQISVTFPDAGGYVSTLTMQVFNK